MAVYSVDQQWYNAVIDSISEDGRTIMVTYPEYGNSEAVTRENVKKISDAPIPPADSATPAPAPVASGWKVGDECESCFSEDGIWYLARIDQISPDGQHFTVTYLEYGNSETVNASSIRPKSSSIQPQEPSKV